MAVIEMLARLRAGAGVPIERLVCHPRLPLVAGLDSARPAVHVWECAEDGLRELRSVHADAAAYPKHPWERFDLVPHVAWHPYEPWLLVTDQRGVISWTPDDVNPLAGVPAEAVYRNLAFSPDGRTLWASPSSSGGEDAWEFSDSLDLSAGTVQVGPRWDTGVVEHPGGGLVLTYRSDQGATLGVFALVDEQVRPGAMRALRRALILDVDGYEAPVFSADGRHFAIRGNSYGHTLQMFEFPSLTCVMSELLARPGGDEESEGGTWSRHNVAFGARPGALWVGTPAGTLVEVDVAADAVAVHEVSPGIAITALAATATGAFVAATGDGELMLLAVRDEAVVTDTDAARAAVAAFTAATVELPDSGDPDDEDEGFVLTDGDRVWERDDLESVTAADKTDPTWLQLRAAVNTVRDRRR
ncbi:hypothetical protein [Catellatospora tritici]|uniref:hypothetical protein n=1 Tax=Catellatospora tritici TaxID=2851566 RepID=UPI001C2D9103|nr:hypothetical protein [Catellatospora tritici]MBV1851263.1 hypothetical protein [Catellatospora tritici]